MIACTERGMEKDATCLNADTLNAGRKNEERVVKNTSLKGKRKLADFGRVSSSGDVTHAGIEATREWCSIQIIVVRK